jgi:bacterioferritin (cytochrome b1)
MSESIRGASVWEQDLYDHLTAHARDEQEILDGYRQLAEGASPAFFAYLARMILNDEERHHQLLGDLAETVRAFAEFRYDEEPIPGVPFKVAGGQEIIDATERYLKVERDDLHVLRELAKKVESVKDTTMWDLMIRLLEMDTEKHIAILEFVRDHTTPA